MYFFTPIFKEKGTNFRGKKIPDEADFLTNDWMNRIKKHRALMHLYIYCVVKTGQIVPQNNLMTFSLRKTIHQLRPVL